MSQILNLMFGLAGNPETNEASAAVTPSQFDSDKSVATTEFVQRALGNMAGVKYVTVPYTLIPADAGKFIIASGNGTVTYPSTGFPAGSGVTISAGINGDNITVSSAVPFSYGGSQVSPISLKNNENVSIVSQGPGNSPLVYAGGLRSSPDFKSLVSQPGYQRFPSGVTLQWGIASGVAGGAVTVALPQAATTQLVAAFGIVYSGVAGYVVTTSDYSVSGFNAHTWSSGTTRAAASFVWFAITI